MGQIYYCRSKNDRVPVKPEVFKHGGGIYLAFTNHDEHVHIPLIGNAAAMVVQLRLTADMIEAAIGAKDQGHISRPENRPATLADLTGDPRHDFPIFVRRFAKTLPDILGAIANHYKERGYKVPGVDSILQAYDDLEVIWPMGSKVLGSKGELVYGARNRIAKALGIRDAGNYRQRIDTVIWLLRSTYNAALEENEPGLEDLEAGLEAPAVKMAVSNTPRSWAKVVNE